MQSQANRLEECLLAAISDGISIPYVEVDFAEVKLDGISKITSLEAPLGITCDHLEHSFVLSFAALRRLRFGGADEAEKAKRVLAGRTLLAALGLVALTEQDSRGCGEGETEVKDYRD